MTLESTGSNSVEFGLTPDGKFVIDGEAFDMEDGEETGAGQEQPKTDSSEAKQLSEESKAGSEEEEGQTEKQPEEVPAAEDKEQGSEPRYTPEEIREIGLDKLDPKRLPPELLPYYKSLQGDYTRKTQQLADERRIIEAAKQSQAEPGKADQELKPGEQPASETAENPFKVIVAAAKSLACSQFLGITPEEFDEFNMEHAAALQTAMRRLEGEATRKAENDQRIAQQTSDFATLCASYRESVPEFDDIATRYFSQWMESKPYRKYNEVISVFKKGTIPEIKRVIDEVILDWRNEKGGKPKEKIPAVESARSTSLVGASGKAGSPKNLGEMTSDEQAEWLVKNKFV